MSLFDIFKGKKINLNPKENRELLQTHGRITDGLITDSETNEAGEQIVFYTYNIQGVDFESSEILDDAQLLDPLQFAPGAKVGIRFDPKNHGNSTLA
jgi:hypothetical protein